jgi:hypothetical protein
MHKNKQVADYMAAGYMSTYQLLDALGHGSTSGMKKQLLVGAWPPYTLEVANVRLWSPDKCLDILCQDNLEKRFQLAALRFIRGDYLPKNYRFKPERRKAA